MNFGRVGVLYGGYSAEREVSLMSGQGVCEALRSKGIDAHLFDIAMHNLSELIQAGFERVFIALHGRFGEDGAIQGALELMRIPYTGSGVLGSSLAMDKVRTKQIWQQHGLPTPAYLTVDCEQDVANVAAKLGLPLVVKPPHEGSTLGLTKVSSAEQLPAAVELACKHDSLALVEQFITGRELTVPILGSGDKTRALPIIEIIAPDGNYDYEHKYISNDTKYVCPADLSPEVTKLVQELVVSAYLAIGCEGWGRADVMLTPDNQAWLLEMNTSPGMTSHSLVPMGALAEGISYADLCVEILSTASCKLAMSEINTK